MRVGEIQNLLSRDSRGQWHCWRVVDHARWRGWWGTRRQAEKGVWPSTVPFFPSKLEVMINRGWQSGPNPCRFASIALDICLGIGRAINVDIIPIVQGQSSSLIHNLPLYDQTCQLCAAAFMLGTVPPWLANSVNGPARSPGPLSADCHRRSRISRARVRDLFYSFLTSQLEL